MYVMILRMVIEELYIVNIVKFYLFRFCGIYFYLGLDFVCVILEYVMLMKKFFVGGVLNIYLRYKYNLLK